MYIYICYHFTDTTTSTLARLSAKITRDMFLKLLLRMSRMLLWPFNQYKEIQNWPRNNLGLEKWTPKWCQKLELNSYKAFTNFNLKMDFPSNLLNKIKC